MLEEFRERTGRRDLRRSMLAAQRAIMSELLLRKDELTTLAAGLKVPTLVMWGAHDRVVSVKTGVRFSSLIPDAELVVLEDAGHTPQLEVPERFTEEIVAFVRRVL
jgi:pimeloyl-ACP methyl ester carboxylesterase